MTATPRHELRGLYHTVRNRWQIILDYAKRHRLSGAEVAELVRDLPGGEERK